MQKVKFIHATLVMVIIAASRLPRRPTPRPFVFKGGSMSRPAAPLQASLLSSKATEVVQRWHTYAYFE